MKKKTIEEFEDDDTVMAEEPMLAPRDPLAKTNRRLLRVVGYIATVAILLVIGVVWWAKSEVLELEIRMEQVNAETFNQINRRLVSLEALKPKPETPRFVEFTPPIDAPALGAVDAPVTVVEFADYQCPFCGRFYSDTYAKIKAEYIDTGKVRFVYQDFAFLGDESHLAAQASKCAGEQGKYWEYHDYLFTHQDGENEGAFAAKNLKAFAKTVGLKQSDFNACLDSGKFKAAVEAETETGRGLGISGTPTVIVAGQVFVGALPYDTFKKAIDQALNK